jgi:hypothetical protein
MKRTRGDTQAEFSRSAKPILSGSAGFPGGHIASPDFFYGKDVK